MGQLSLDPASGPFTIDISRISFPLRTLAIGRPNPLHR